MSDDAIASVTERASQEAGGLPPDLLGGFVTDLVAAVRRDQPLGTREMRSFRRVGERAARDGIALRALLDLYLTASRELWPHLVGPDDDAGTVAAAGRVVLTATDDVVGALTEGHQLARRSLVRAQEAARREFIDDLLGGVTDVVGLLHRADGFGLDLSGPHAVLTIDADRQVNDGAPLIGRLERAIQGVKGDAETLLASKDGRLVIVFAAPDTTAVQHVVQRTDSTLTADRGDRLGLTRWRLGVGRPGSGADGVVSSYRDSVDALELAARLGLTERIVDARDVLVYRMLSRDRTALGDLVEQTLGRLRNARGGAGPLVRTVNAYLSGGSNTASAARELHLSVRAVTYRLERVRELTGLDPTRPADRFTLHVAVVGARLLDWPG